MAEHGLPGKKMTAGDAFLPVYPASGMTAQQRQAKRRLIHRTIFACLALLPFLFFFEMQVFKRLGPMPAYSNILFFAVININVLLGLLVIFLILRSAVELFFEQRQKFIGARLRTKMVISFVAMSLAPTSLLFVIALQFMTSSMEYWFNNNLESALDKSRLIARASFLETNDRAQRLAGILADELSSLPRSQWEKAALSPLLAQKMTALPEGAPDAAAVYTAERLPHAEARTARLGELPLPPLPPDIVLDAVRGRTQPVQSQKTAMGELVTAFTALRDPDGTSWLLAVSVLIPREKMEQLEFVSRGLEGYRQLLFFKDFFKTGIVITLIVVTLLIVFAAIWFGFFVARGLTIPMDRLSWATRLIASGRYDFNIENTSHDEMGQLIDSFNQMTRELSTSKKDLELANEALMAGNLELESRRRYMETVLQNVTAGVISLDADGTITTVNRFAEELLHIDSRRFVGHHYRQVLAPQHTQMLETFLAQMNASARPFFQEPIRLTVGKETFSLLVHFSRLTDDQGNFLGVVIVFDNLTQLEKAQRMAAWREVARRIAHEVKNPLTPIQLSAQRLRKRYLDTLKGEGEVFDRCTSTIIEQVDELKKLVEEFSSFARMPALEKGRHDMSRMVDDVLVLYREGHKKILFGHQLPGGPVPPFSFDLRQIKRVLINLLDNAIAALGDQGTIDIILALDVEKKNVLLDVADNGPGISPQDKTRLFEPYFSTKKSGTGLGLSIVSTIATDHGGSIQALDNSPSGAVFRLSLPFLQEGG